MSNYYKFPWHIEEFKYRDGDRGLRIYSSNGGCIGDVYRQSSNTNENEWKFIASLMTVAPELMCIIRALCNNTIDYRHKELAQSVIHAIESEGYSNKSLWKNVDDLIEEIQESNE